MNLDDFSFSDFEIIDTIKMENKLMFYFTKVFILKENKYISNFVLIVENWTEIDIEIFISSEPFGNSIQKKVTLLEADTFELIQEVVVNDNILQLKGFGKKTGHWLEYSFKNYSVDYFIAK